MAARKTITLRPLVERANFFLANSEDERSDARIAVATLIESALQDADAYEGFRYLPGVLDAEKPDHSRRQYTLS